MKRFSSLAAVLVLVPGLALAAVGKVAVLEGSAKRVPKSGEAAALKVGSEIELGDKIHVGEKSNLKLMLNDSSVLMVGEKSELEITEAQFQNLERSGFSAKLLFGKVWAKVTRAIGGSDSKFEVSTERAVAGVRGTIFRVDAAKLLNAVKHTTVKVEAGKVAVAAKLPPPKVAAATPAKAKGPRVQVAGPTEISAKQWEEKFVELQARQQVEVGEELSERPYDPEQDKDAFAQFVKKNQ